MVKGDLLALLIYTCVDHDEVMMLKFVQKLDIGGKKFKVQFPIKTPLAIRRNHNI